MSYEKDELMKTAAGRRLIAYLTIFNKGNMDRINDYIRDNYSDQAFETRSQDEWLQWTEDIQTQVSKLRIHQVVAADDHHVVVLVQAQKDSAFYMCDYKVDDEFPHKVLTYTHQAVG